MNENLEPVSYEKWLMNVLRQDEANAELDLANLYLDYVKDLARIQREIKQLERDRSRAQHAIFELECEAETRPAIVLYEKIKNNEVTESSFTFSENQDEVA